MKRMLSTELTVIHKGLWIFLSIVLIALLCLSYEIPNPEFSKKLPIIPVFLFGSAGIFWAWYSSRKYMYVGIDGEKLEISDGKRTITVSASEIKSVSNSMLFTPEIISISLKTKSEFGDEIIFIPWTRLFPFGSHPVVEELKQLAANQTGGRV